jgi:hypothetical protein
VNLRQAWHHLAVKHRWSSAVKKTVNKPCQNRAKSGNRGLDFASRKMLKSDVATRVSGNQQRIANWATGTLLMQTILTIWVGDCRSWLARYYPFRLPRFVIPTWPRRCRASSRTDAAMPTVPPARDSTLKSAGSFNRSTKHGSRLRVGRSSSDSRRSCTSHARPDRCRYPGARVGSRWHFCRAVGFSIMAAHGPLEEQGP